MFNRYVSMLTVMMVAAGLGGFVVPNNAPALEGKPTGWCVDSSGKVFRCSDELGTKTSSEPCHLGYRPQLVNAKLIRSYRGGPYEAALFGEIVSAGGVKYLYVLEVSKSDFPCLYVASEINALGPAGKGPYFLGVFSGKGHHNYGLSDDWGYLDLFEARALELVRQYLGEDLKRERAPSSAKPKKHPFLSASALNPLEELRLKEVPGKAKSLEEFLVLLGERGYRIKKKE